MLIFSSFCALPSPSFASWSSPFVSFPRWYARDWKETGALGPTLVSAGAGGGKGFAETVREYLAQELIQHDEAESAAIVKLADGLLKDMDN